MRHPLGRILQRARWVTMGVYLAALPVDYEFDVPGQEAPRDTSKVAPFERSLDVGGAVGRGRVFAVIRDCDGDKVSETGADLGDWSGHANLSLPIDEHAEVVLGVRVDGLTVDAPTGGRDWPRRQYTWLTPSIAAEGLHAGVGAGVMLGDKPDEFGRGGGTDLAPLAMHLRLGRRDRMFLKLSYMEARPAMSGGGPLMLQLGYALGSRFGGSTGLAGTWYDTAAVVQSLRVQVHPRWTWEASVRIPVEDVGEHAWAMGMSYRLPLPGSSP